VKSKKIKLFILVTILLSSFLLFTTPVVMKICCASEYRTFNSPDRNNYLKVYRYKPFYMVMPGGAGDASGYIQLYNKNDELMREKEIEMIQMANNVQWTKSHVKIKLIANWKLD